MELSGRTRIICLILLLKGFALVKDFYNIRYSNIIIKNLEQRVTL